MKKLGTIIRPYIHPSGRILVRIRWNHSKNEVTFSAGCSAERTKWNSTTSRAKINTTHVVGGKSYSAKEINGRVENVIEIINEVFYQFEVQEKNPSIDNVKEAVNKALHPVLSDCLLPYNSEGEVKGIYLDDLLDDFLVMRPMEVNWEKKTHFRYREVVDKYHAFANKKQVRLLEINKRALTEFKAWFFDPRNHKKPYSNYTVMKHFRNLKGLLNWGKENGYKVHPESITFKANIQTIRKTVTFLTYEEIKRLGAYVFPESKKYLERVRDVFCFGCYTSLRHSDLLALRKANIKGSSIEIVTQKTDDLLYIPLIPQAQAILEKYKDMPGDHALPVVSDQKSNTYIKEAAKLAGLNREIVEVNMIGNKRVDSVSKLHETISMHDARRSFVCNSLAFGIPANVVQSITGHKDMQTMRAYIGTADNTVKNEMKKWSSKPIRQRIDILLDGMTDEQLEAAYSMLTQD